MRSFIIAAAMSGIGALAGYELYPLAHPAANTAHDLPGDSAREAIELELTAEQLDRLAARIAPAVARKIAAAGRDNPSAPRSTAGKSEAEQARAFDDAAQLVDQMIASRRVTSDGMNEARQLLDASGQSERMFEISARVSAAVNRGELTPQQAGLAVR